MKFWKTISLILLFSFITGLTVAAIMDAKLSLTRVAFCEYANSFAKTSKDIKVSQKNGYENLELIQCDGEAKIIRDDKNQVQNFTLFFPKGKYETKITETSTVTNIILYKPGSIENIPTPTKIIPKMEF